LRHEARSRRWRQGAKLPFLKRQGTGLDTVVPLLQRNPQSQNDLVVGLQPLAASHYRFSHANRKTLVLAVYLPALILDVLLDTSNLRAAELFGAVRRRIARMID